MKIKDLKMEDFNFIQDDPVILLKDAIDLKKQNCERYKTGFNIFDKAMNGGFKDGDLAIISGVSGEGKTSIAQTLTYNFCKNALSCLWFSYEVSLEHLDTKFKRMGIENFYNIYTPKKNTTGKLAWLKSKIKEGWIKYATKIVFVDHIDFLTPSDVRTSDNETIALKKIATELKSIAIELGITIICMAHLKKLPDGKEPDMQDIGYSAGVFQLADYVFIIMREKIKQKSKYGIEKIGEDVYTNNSILKCVKNRETGINKILKLQYQNEKFTEIINTEPLGGYEGRTPFYNNMA